MSEPTTTTTTNGSSTNGSSDGSSTVVRERKDSVVPLDFRSLMNFSDTVSDDEGDKDSGQCSADPASGETSFSGSVWSQSDKVRMPGGAAQLLACDSPNRQTLSRARLGEKRAATPVADKKEPPDLVPAMDIFPGQPPARHEWADRKFGISVYCNYCRKPGGGGVGKKAVLPRCEICHARVHSHCKDKLEVGGHLCQANYVFETDIAGRSRLVHHWVRSEHKRHKACSIKQVPGPTDKRVWRCSWCKVVVIGTERAKYLDKTACGLGEFRRSIVPANAVVAGQQSEEDDEGGRARRPQRKRSHTEEIISNTSLMGLANNEPPSSLEAHRKDSNIDIGKLSFHIDCSKIADDVRPLLVFVNSKSGGNQGRRILERFRYLLNPCQVIDLGVNGCKDALKLYRQVPNLRILACGGDGTVGWVLSELDHLRLPGVAPPTVGVLPLGTGNDLSRVLGWGGGYEHEDMKGIIKDATNCGTIEMDRWAVDAGPYKGPLVPLRQEATEDATAELPVPVMNNYLSVGVDATVALLFHEGRELHPEKYKSRFRNKVIYTKKILSAMKNADKSLYKTTRLWIDGKEVTETLKNHKLQGVLVINIPSYGGGTFKNKQVWNSKKHEAHKEMSINDGLVEVLGVGNMMSMGMRSLVNNQIVIGQGSKVVIELASVMAIQVDGEPALLKPSTIVFTKYTTSPMMYNPDKAY